MRYITKGEGTGQIQVRLKEYGLRVNEHRSALEATIKKLGNVTDVKIDHSGWLTATVNCKHLKEARRRVVINKTINQIDRILARKREAQDSTAHALTQV